VTLQEWLGDLPLAFAAEHGLWRKDFDGEWLPTVAVEGGWKTSIDAIMRRYVGMLEGSFIEEKVVALVFHYRNVTSSNANEMVERLIRELEPLLAPSSLRILHGKKVVEVLPDAVNKGAAAKFWINKKPYDFILAAGDDVTDEALFAAMPGEAVTIKVGEGETAANHRMASQPEFIELLTLLSRID
jgi:trehalose 6-phosphate synthase/phosphatase